MMFITKSIGLAYRYSEVSELLPPLSSMDSTFISLSLFLLSCLLSLHVSATIVLEDGYTVATIINGHKLNINPHSVLPLPGSSDLIVLDSFHSVFYTIQFPTSQDIVVKNFSGDGSCGYSDGDMVSAKFNKPKSFAVDFKGTVYVADKNNNAIRKITGSGVTTIAGGFSHKPGSADGPAQNATFSDDFELSFVPGKCALLVSDHGNGLIRQISLKEEDCTLGSKSGLGAVMIWTLGLGLSCLLGIIVGFAVRPYIIPHTGRLQEPLIRHDMEALPTQAGEGNTGVLLRLEALPTRAGEGNTDVLLRHQKRSC